MRNRVIQRARISLVCVTVLAAGSLVSCAGAGSGSVQFAYAHVLGNDTLDTANSRNVTGMAGGNGLYCFKVTFDPKSAVATIADDPTAPDQGLGFITVALPPTPLFTCSALPAANAVVATFKPSGIGSGASAGGHAFYVYWAR